ncbi:uncharacterized protein LOC124643268 [Helicoverpa zea]|uniref:uncharacterized protein LOC124643268 n=1 Tax=Helicoverpa zea TaxID=7113 RepID=UPI000B38FB17|nr:uncharacterized protein LOC124643268 [Helicoverpa zea]
MGIDPLSAFLLGTCCCVCWPCLLPLCLSLPVIPLPMLIIRDQRPCPSPQNPQYRAETGFPGGLRSSLRTFPFDFSGQRYNVIWDNNDLVFQPTSKALVTE